MMRPTCNIFTFLSTHNQVPIPYTILIILVIMIGFWTLGPHNFYTIPKCFFTCLNPIKHIIVKLPNGASIIIKLSGSIHFNDNFYLHDVLHIPNFITNLIFFYKLAHSLNYAFIFYISSLSHTGDPYLDED